MAQIFKYEDVINAVFDALKDLDGGGTNADIKTKVIEVLNCTPEMANNLLKNGKNELDLKISYSKTLLKANGIITNPRPGSWILIGDYRDENAHIDASKIYKSYESHRRNGKDENEIDEDKISPAELTRTDEEISEEQIKSLLLGEVKKTTWQGFESLCDYVLEKLGISMKPTKKSNDYGVDSYGVCKINKVVEFHIATQYKHYDGTKVDRPAIQSFRGSIHSGIDRGIFITASSFKDTASAEANDDKQSPRIVLIDGNRFAEILFENEIGYKKIETTKFYPDQTTSISYAIDDDFFEQYMKK